MNLFWYELPLVWTSGLLGSVHCVGMCGPICLTMNLGTRTRKAALARQLFWSAGRIFTYAFLGMTAGFAGAQMTESRLIRSQSLGLLLQAAFAVLAGGLLVLQGISAAGWMPAWHRRSGGSCVTAPVLSRFLKGGSNLSVFVAGIATGFLPCGLVWSFLALAAAEGSVWRGPLLMTAFGLGTVPVLLLTGTGLSMASPAGRRRMMKFAAVCVLATGLMTMGRGIAFAARSPDTSAVDACPLCTQEVQPEAPGKDGADSTASPLASPNERSSGADDAASQGN